MSPLQSVVLDGSPYQRGVAHGEQFSGAIERNVGTYFEYFADHGVDEETARDQAERFIPLIEEENEDYAEEMRGVADGSGVSLEEVALVNVRHTIIYGAFATEAVDDASLDGSADIVDGCTSYGLEPRVTADAHTYLGQNWDWLAPIERFLMGVRQDEGPDFLTLTEAGMVGGKFGLNEHGIGYVVNGLSTPTDGEDPFRKPSHVRGREILEADRLDTAIEPIIDGKRPCSRNYMVGHADGLVLDIETTPDTVQYLYPEDGLLTHANHFEKRANVDSKLETLISHTVCRGMRIERLFSDIGDGITVDDIQTVLRDHFDKPNSICSHVDERSDDRVQTNASIIMDLSERRLLAADGPPCHNDYHEYPVGGA